MAELITIKEFWQKYRGNVSYEAIRQQVKKHENAELKGHIIRNGKAKLLDEEAVRILSSMRAEPVEVIPQVVAEGDIAKRYYALLEEQHKQDAEIKAKDARIQQLMEQISDTKLLLAERDSKILLIDAAADEQQKQLTAKDEEIQQLQQQLEEEKKRKISLREWFSRL